METMWTSWKTSLAVIVTFHQIQAVISIKSVTGTEDQMFQFRCDYAVGWENKSKYFRHLDEKESNDNEIQINSHNTWKTKGRFSAYDNTSDAFFIIRVDKLCPNDSGMYLCGVKLMDQPDSISLMQLNVSQVTEIPEDIKGYTVHKFTLQLFLTAMLCISAMLFVCLFTIFLLMAVKQKKSAPHNKREPSADYETMMPSVQAETQPCCCCPHVDCTDLSTLPRPTSDPCSHPSFGQRDSVVSFSLCDYADVDVQEYVCQYHNLDHSQLEEHIYHSLHGNHDTKEIV